MEARYDNTSIKTEDDYGLDALPLVVVFASMVLIALLAIETGLWLGRRSQKKLGDEPVRPIATVVGAVLGMMAFVIALTFGSANNRFDARKAALLEDVTAIQTAYLRANLLPEPHRTTVRSLLRDYVQARAGIVYAYGQPDTLRLVQRRAKALQESMWSHVEKPWPRRMVIPGSMCYSPRPSTTFLIRTTSVSFSGRTTEFRVLSGGRSFLPPVWRWSL